MTASGRDDLIGKVADKWDAIPVKGAMAVAVAAVGGILAFSNGGLAKGSCDTTPLQHVYNPKRLHVIAKCQDITGTVVAWRHEHDGDYHVNMVIDGGGWTNAANVRGQHGQTVVEWVPGNPRPKRFFKGQRLRLRVTKVYDQQHKRTTEQWGWIEGHPVFAVKELAGPGAPVTGPPPPEAPPTEPEG